MAAIRVPINSVVEEVGFLLCALEQQSKLNWYNSPKGPYSSRSITLTGRVGEEYFVTMERMGGAPELIIENTELGRFQFVPRTKNERPDPFWYLAEIFDDKLPASHASSLAERLEWPVPYKMAAELKKSLEAML